MKLATILILVLSLIFLCASVVPLTHSMVIADSLTPPPGVTGAPTQGTCATCHLGTGGTGGIVAVPTVGVFTYNPGQTDTIGVAVANSGSSRWGFELTALKNNGSMAGSFANLPGTNTLIQSSGGKDYISQTSNGATVQFDPTDGTWWGIPGGAGWLLEWTAPPPGSGPVTLYVSGVAANGDGLAGATDTTFTYSLQLTEQGTAVTPTTWGKIKQIYR